MRTFTTTTTVYKFDELSDEAKEKALQEHTENNYMPFLSADMNERLHELLGENKLKYDEQPEVLYSLSYSQGDGAMFEGTVYYKAWRVDISHSGHYYHENSKDLDITSVKTGNDAPDKVYSEFNELYVSICKELEQYGYDQIEWQNSEEYFAEMCEANEYEFTKDGVMV